MNIDDDMLLLSEMEKKPEMVPPSVVRDMVTVLRILGAATCTDSPGDVLGHFDILNDQPITLDQYIDRKHGNHL